jgi:hypothetical protein
MAADRQLGGGTHVRCSEATEAIAWSHVRHSPLLGSESRDWNPCGLKEPMDSAEILPAQ